MNELICTECSFKFDEKARCPRILNCGHTFCHSCLDIILSASGPKKCPKCRAGYACQRADSIPVNFALMNFITPEVTTLTFPRTKKDLIQLIKSFPVYAEEDRYEGCTRYGKLAFNEGRIWVNSFQLEKPPAVCIPFKDLLSKFGESSELLSTTTAFLKLSPYCDCDDDAISDYDDFYVQIDTDGVSPRAKNFLLLCSGLKGSSYKHKTLEGNASPYYYQIPRGPPPVVDGISFRDARTQMNKGAVFGMTEVESGFSILMEDSSNLEFKIGDVISGLNEIRTESCHIADCGLVI